MSTLYVKGKVDKNGGSLLQQYTGLREDTEILADNYFYSIFPGMLTLFQMLIGACTAALRCCRALPYAALMLR